MGYKKREPRRGRGSFAFVKDAKDGDLFAELIRRGYRVEVPGGKISNLFVADADGHGEVVSMQEYTIHVPERSYLYKRPG